MVVGSGWRKNIGARIGGSMNMRHLYTLASIVICTTVLAYAGETTPNPPTKNGTIACTDKHRMLAIVPTFENLNPVSKELFSNADQTIYNNAGCEERATALSILDKLWALGFFNRKDSTNNLVISALSKNSLTLNVPTNFIADASRTEFFHPKLGIDNWLHAPKDGKTIILNASSKDKRGTLHIVITTDGHNHEAPYTHRPMERWSFSYVSRGSFPKRKEAPPCYLGTNKSAEIDTPAMPSCASSPLTNLFAFRHQTPYKRRNFNPNKGTHDELIRHGDQHGIQNNGRRWY
jgi:hypothetical protein